jgi:putative transposase
MNGYFLLTEQQFSRIWPYLPLSRGLRRVDDIRVISGIISVIRNGLSKRVCLQ